MPVEILIAFTAYPAGIERAFVPGERPTDLPEGWPEMLVAKGLAREIPPDDAP